MPPWSDEGVMRHGVSEVIGTLILIGVVVAGMTLVAILLLSQPLPTKVPVLDVIISNQSRNIYIYHKGGDPLVRGQYQILVDGGDQTGNFTNSGDEPWSVGETLGNTTPSMPHRVVIVLNGTGGGGSILAVQDLSGARTAPQVQSNGWYNLSVSGQCDWPYRKSVTIDHTQVASPGQSSFPVLISIASDPDLSAHARTTGNDILFTSSGGTTKIPHEIESYSSGSLVAWVSVPTLSSTTDTVLYLYYGNSTGTASQQNPTALWTNYGAVWHMKETNGGSGAIKDSTSYGNNGTGLGGPTLGAAGKIGNAIDFDGLNDVMYVENSGSTSSLDYTSGPFTISAWIYRRNTDVHIAGKRDGNADQYQFAISPSGRLLFTANNDNKEGLSGEVTIPSTWNYGVVVVNASNYPEFYLNGTHEQWVDSSGTRPYSFPHRNVNFSIGARWATFPATGARYSGLIDEVRVSNVDRSVQWIATEYNNQRRPSTFSSVGNEEQYWRC
jgi:hypothetical protein